MTTNGFDFDTGITVSNGGLNAPLGDMAKYLSFLVGDQNSSVTILKRSSLEEMWQIEHPVAEDSILKEWIALGFFVLEAGSQRFIGHTGEQRGFMSFFYIHPESQTGCLVAFNTVINTYSVDKELLEPNTISLRSKLRLKMLEDVFPHYLKR
jgi:CubicO group peptidase (beta-lactamase class C family)